MNLTFQHIEKYKNRFEFYFNTVYIWIIKYFENLFFRIKILGA